VNAVLAHAATCTRRDLELAAILAGIVLGAACRSQAEREADIANGDDPVAALSVSAPSARYTTRYWLTQAEQDAAVWSRAAAYCREQRAAAQGTKPNCAAVYEAESDLSVRTLRPRRPPAGQQLDSLTFRP
jgi:hypothetical protein